MKTTFHGKLIAKRPDAYTLYVFENLDNTKDPLMRYVTTTVCPNWVGHQPTIGDIGFVECEYTSAGETYIKTTTGESNTYKHNACYFINFVKDQPVDNVKDYKF